MESSKYKNVNGGANCKKKKSEPPAEPHSENRNLKPSGTILSIDQRKKKSYNEVTLNLNKVKEKLFKTESSLIEETKILTDLCIVVIYTEDKMYFQKDINRIQEVVGGLLDFKIEVIKDRTYNELKKYVVQMVDNHQKLMVILLSHGLEGKIKIVDDSLSSEIFIDLFMKLSASIKIFLLSFCRGDQTIAEGFKVPEEKPDHPYYDNTLIIYSQWPGYKVHCGEDGDIFLNKWLDIVEDIYHCYDYETIDAIEIQKDIETYFIVTLTIKHDGDIRKQIPVHYTHMDKCIHELPSTNMRRKEPMEVADTIIGYRHG